MCYSNCIKLPFWETIRRSLSHAFSNLDIFFKLSSVWMLVLIYEIFSGFPLICRITEETCPNNLNQNISLILLSLASVSISVSYVRNVVLREKIKFFQLRFGLKELKYLLYRIVVILAIFVPSILLMILFGSLMLNNGFSQESLDWLILIPVLFALVISKCYLVFPAVAVGNKVVGLRKSFKITCGNANKIFWGQFLMMIPTIFFAAVLSVIYQSIEHTDTVAVKITFAALIMFVSYFDACLKSSFHSHIYQYFMYFADVKPMPVSKPVVEKTSTGETRQLITILAPSKSAPKAPSIKAPVAKKPVAKKAATKKPAAKKAPAKKAPAKKAVVKKKK